MIALTKAQAELLAVLKREISECGIAPSFEELKQELGIASKSGVHRLVSALEERGYIRRLPNKARAIELVKRPATLPTLSFFSTTDLLHELARRSSENRGAA